MNIREENNGKGALLIGALAFLLVAVIGLVKPCHIMSSELVVNLNPLAVPSYTTPLLTSSILLSPLWLACSAFLFLAYNKLRKNEA